VADLSPIDRDLQRLAADLKRLEAEYNQFFAGRLARPPLETRERVEALVRRYDRAYIESYEDRFRFSTLQSRFAALVELWDRGLRAREEGRPGPFSARASGASARPGLPDCVLHVATFEERGAERQRIGELYRSVAEARRMAGEPPIAFERFAELVTAEVERLQRSGWQEVAFSVALKEGRVSFTARAIKVQRAAGRRAGDRIERTAG